MLVSVIGLCQIFKFVHLLFIFTLYQPMIYFIHLSEVYGSVFVCLYVYTLLQLLKDQ